MGTVNSDLITNIVASPTVKNDVGVSGGRLRIQAGTIALGTGDIDDNDIIRLCRLPIKARIFGIYFLNGDLDTGGTGLTFNIGLYQTDGTVIDEDCYALDAAQLQGAVTTLMTNHAFEQRDINAIEQVLWEDAGLSAVPSYGEVDLCITISAVATTAAAEQLTFMVYYTID